MDTSSRTRSDIGRQVVVISAVVFMLVAAMVGVGLFGGTNVRDLQGGALDADATLIAPARPAFSIWSVVYVLMIAYAVWQALPGQRDRERQRRLGGWIALTAVLNGLWLVAAQFSTLPVTVLVIVALLVVLALTLRQLVLLPPTTAAERVLMDATVGVHLGWVSLATVANVTAWLAAEVVPPLDLHTQEVWAVIVLVVVALVGVALAWGTRTPQARGRLAPALAMAWGLSWIAVARLTDQPHSVTVGVAAVLAAVIVLAAPFVLGRRTVRP